MKHEKNLKYINIHLLDEEINNIKNDIKDDKSKEHNTDNEKQKINLIIPINTRIYTEHEYTILNDHNKTNEITIIDSSNINKQVTNSLSTIKSSNVNKNNSNTSSSESNKNKLNTKHNCEFEQVNYENKKRNHAEMIKSSTTNEISNQQNNLQKNKKFRFPTNSFTNNYSNLDPEKKIFSTWSVEKMEDELDKLKKNISDLEKENNSDGKKKKDLEKFSTLKTKWLRISQDAIYTILDLHPQNNNYEKNTIKSILSHFRIDKEIIEYDSENECFKE